MKQRLITGIIGGSAFLLLLYLGSYWFAALILLLSLIGFHEYVRMVKCKSTDVSSFVGYLFIIFFVLPWKQLDFVRIPSFEAAAWLLLFLLLSITVITKNRVTFEKAAVLFLGAVYIGTGFHYMIYTRWMEHGLFWTFLLFACIWATDSGAYFTGRAIGKRPLWPAISPKKTVEGALGGVIISVAVAIGFSLYAPDVLEINQAVWIGIVAAVVGQMGDLIQSAYKRVSGIKDTGAILPGHGGVLDRCDSWIIVFPFVHLLSLLS